PRANATCRSTRPVQQTDIQQRRCVDILGIHHRRDALQRRQDHAALPVLERTELPNEGFLQRFGRSCYHFASTLGERHYYLATVLLGTFSQHQSSVFQTIQNVGDCCLTQTDDTCQLTHRGCTTILDDLQQDQL